MIPISNCRFASSSTTDNNFNTKHLHESSKLLSCASYFVYCIPTKNFTLLVICNKYWANGNFLRKLLFSSWKSKSGSRRWRSEQDHRAVHKNKNKKTNKTTYFRQYIRCTGPFIISTVHWSSYLSEPNLRIRILVI